MGLGISARPQVLVRRLEDRQWFEAVHGERIAIRIRSEQVGGAYAVVEGILSPSSGPSLHIHENEDEIIEVLDGSLRVVCNGDDFEAPAGTFVVIPRACRTRGGTRRIAQCWRAQPSLPAAPKVCSTHLPGDLWKNSKRLQAGSARGSSGRGCNVSWRIGAGEDAPETWLFDPS